MEYIVAKAYDENGIDGPLHLTKGASVFERNGIICYNGKKVCYVTSQQARDFMARNDDGKGRKRFQLTHEILDAVAQMNKDYADEVAEVLAGFERDEEGNYPEEAAVAVGAVQNKPAEFFDAMNADATFANYLTNGYWNFNFFNAEIADLERLQALL